MESPIQRNPALKSAQNAYWLARELRFIRGILPYTLTGQRRDASLFRIAPGDIALLRSMRLRYRIRVVLKPNWTR